MSNRGDLLRVRAQFERTQAKQETRLDRFLALMGDGEGNLEVPGVPLFVYVRVQGRGVVECLNRVAPLRSDLPLVVGYDFKRPDTLQVLSIYEGGMASFGPYAYLPPHHQAHEFRNADGGDDVVWIQKQAVIPLLCRPTSPTSMFVEVLEDNYPWLSGWNLFPGATSADLTARVPGVGNARFVLIYVDGATNILGYWNGTPFPTGWPPGTAFSLTPAPPAGCVPVASIYLPNGITAIDWDNIYDVRLFNQPIGGSVTPGPHALLDSAVHSDTVTNTPPAQGSIIVADATPDWDELVHPGGAGYALTTDATDVIWDQTPTWTGNHAFNAGLTVPAAQGITMGDLSWIGLGPAAGRLTFDDAVPDVASFDGCGHVDIENVLGHIGDADTYLIFAPDSIVLRAGGVDLIHATTVGVDRVEINPNEDDADFIVNSNGLADAFLVDGATGAISVTGPSLTVPATWNLIIQDNVADAFSIDDNGDADVFLQIVTTTGSEEVIFNAGGDDVDFTVQAVGVADALQVQGSDGQITLGALTAGFVKSSAGGVLSVALEVALAELASYAQGTMIRGGIVDWETFAAGGAGWALVSTGIAPGFDQTPAWTGEHSFGAGIAFTGASGANEITIPDNTAIALEILDAGGLEYVCIVSTNANPYFLIDSAGAGVKVGIGTLAVPHGAIGAALFALDGTDGSVAAGPHVQITTDADDHPLFQQLNWAHDNITLVFDAYHDGAWKSSDAGSNAAIAKWDNLLRFRYDSGVAQGGAVTWNDGIILDLATGYVGIGMLPTYRLDVTTNHAAGWAGNFFNDGDNVNRYGVRIQCGDDDADTAGTAYHLIFYDGDGGGCGGIRTVAGVTAIYQTSDEKLKKDIRPTTRKGVEEILALPVRDFKWKGGKKTDPFYTGFVAQEVEKVIPQAVGELDDIKTLSTAYFIPMLVKAVQELDVRLSQVETH